MKKFIVGLSFTALGLFVGFNEAPAQQGYEFLSSIRLPEKMELCGEVLPLDNPEIKERAEREFYLLLQQPGQIILYMKRAARLFPMYEKVIKENGLPDDLKYLSVAESALFQSRSDKGAVGLWQLMEGTAKTLGLRVDSYVDERRHPEKSCRAAMKYLRNGFTANRSWAMTLAGYNMGQTGVRKSADFQSAETYFDLYLNEETSRFVFRIAAIKEILSKPEKYGFKLRKEDLYQPYKTKTIQVKESIPNISEWAKTHGCSYKDVKILNPWIMEKSLPSPKGEAYEIEIPEKK